MSIKKDDIYVCSQNINERMYLLLTVTHYLIFWPEEDLVFTVLLKSVINKNTTDVLDVGAECEVRVSGKHTYKGKVVACSKCDTIIILSLIFL